MKKTLSTLALAMLVAAPAMAYEPGDWIFRGGVTQISPDASSDPVTIDGADSGGKADVEDNTQLGLTATYMLTNRLGIEVLASIPFTHTVIGTEALSGLGEIADVNVLPPTFSAIYYLTDGKKFNPYVGAGINYSLMYDEEGKGSFSGERVKLDDSIGLAIQVGSDFEINKDFHVNASARWMDIETDADLTLGGQAVKTTVEIDPMVYSIMIGYSF